MSEQARGIVYRILLIVFTGLVVFNILDSDQANQALAIVVSLLGLGGSGLATRNTTVRWRRSKES